MPSRTLQYSKGRPGFLFNAAFLLLLSFFLFPSCGRKSISDAQALVDAWKLAEAQQVLEVLMKTNPDFPTRRLYAHVLLQRGELLRAREQYAMLTATDSALHLSHRIDLGFALFYLGELDSAESCARTVLESRGPLDSLMVSRCFNLLGLVSFNRGLYDRAFLQQMRSLTAARAASSPVAEANALRQLGVLVWYRGYSDSAAATYYLPALDLYRRANDKIGEATTLSNLGLLYNDRRERIAGLSYQLEAFRIRSQTGDLRGLADSYYFLTATGTRGKTGGFDYIYRMKSLELSARIGYAWGREVAARALEELVSSTFRTYANEADTGSLPRTAEGRLHHRWNRALKYAAEGRWDSTIVLLQHVLALTDSLGYRQGRHLAFFQLGQALYNIGRFSEARAMLEKALHDSGKPSVFETDPIEIELARVLLRLGKNTEGLRRLKAVTSHLDSLYLSSVQNPGLPFSVEQATEMVYNGRRTAYELLVEVSLERAVDEVFRFVEQERALMFWGHREQRAAEKDERRDAVSLYVQLLEEFEEDPERYEDKALFDARISELQETAIAEQRVLAEAGKQVKLVPIPSLQDVRRVLLPGEVFLQYFLTERRVIVIAVRGHSSRLQVLSVPPGELTESARSFRELILRGKDNPGDTLWRAPSVFLFKGLLGPLEQTGLIQPGDRLLISPHRILHHLPFQALLGGDQLNGRFFVAERYSVCTVPSATWLVQVRATVPKIPGTLVAAAPMGEDLPFSEEEVRRIPAGQFMKARILENDEATIGEILRLLPQYDVVHLATHARMNRRYPLYSFIECSDGRLELHEMFNHPGPARLVVLSGCETGVGGGIYGRDLASEEFVSFPRVFLQNGVPSVIASLWVVEDESAARFFGQFYQSLLSQPRPSLNDAFVNAQRHFLQNLAKNTALRHPFSWASFQLFGDGR